jgi:hypothetical protein
MPKSRRVIAALLFVTAQLRIPAAMAGEAVSSSGPAPQIVAFDNEDFLRDHIPIVGTLKDLGQWGHSLSSRGILSGTWEFFDDEHCTGTSMGTLGPGTSADVTQHGLKHNSLSSVRLAKPAGGAPRERGPAGGSCRRRLTGAADAALDALSAGGRRRWTGAACPPEAPAGEGDTDALERHRGTTRHHS